MESTESLQSFLNDPHRLAALRAVALLDTPTEEAFDRLSRLATHLTKAPVALVSLVDSDRQFFKSCIGLPKPLNTSRETPLSHSFCQHNRVAGEPLIIVDARKEPLFKDNLAVRDLNVIAYLGIPLVTSDLYVLGSFCVIDSKPRSWTEEEIENVRDLAAAVMTEIDLRTEIAERNKVEGIRDDLSVVNALAQKISATLSLTDVLTFAQEKLHEVIKPDFIVSYLLKQDSLVLETQFNREKGDAIEAPEIKSIGQCLCGIAAQEGKPVYSMDISDDPRCTLNECKDAGIRSFAALPLTVDGGIEGVIGVGMLEIRDFKEQATLLEAVSHQVAISVKTANLHNQLQEHADELERLVREQNQTETALVQSQTELRALSDHLHSFIEEERTRIAREIHDDLGQILTALKMDLTWIQKKMPDSNRPVLDKTIQMVGLIDTAVQTVKTICSDLRPGILDDFGLGAAIEWLISDFEKRFNIECYLEIEPEEMILEEEQSTSIFRICQETITNIARHADANRADISLKQENNRIIINVRDNGIGIDEDKLSNPSSLGLIGIRERVKKYGGNIEIDGNPHSGTAIRVTMPIVSKQKLLQKHD